MKISLKNFFNNAARAVAAVAGGVLLGSILTGGSLAAAMGAGITAAVGAVGLGTVTLPMLGVGALAVAAAARLARPIRDVYRNYNYTKYVKKYYPGSPLTDGETYFARSIFGNDLSPEFLEGTTKHYLPTRGNTAAAVYGKENRIEFYGNSARVADYSRTKDAFKFGTFMHEMTHIWQGKHPILSHRRFHPYKRIYNYQLTPRSRFVTFGDEQQAAIVEDYALRFIFNGHSRWIANTPETDALLKNVVEKQFPAARETRLQMQARKPGF